MPERVRPESLTWYDYVLARGPAPQLARAQDRWAHVYAGQRYDVWKQLR
jgi:hypothetical protein